MGYRQSHPLLEWSIGCHLKSILVPCDPTGQLLTLLACPGMDSVSHDGTGKEGHRPTIDYYSHDYRPSSVIFSISLAG